MYILQTRNFVSGWVDMEEKESAHDLTEAYRELIHRGRPLESVRIIRVMKIKVDTTVEVVK
ncbi:hypothetical protein [Priestia flexa]|uniref:Uncharacterized protein n=1 Tax=Priestia flexa TaxID=86664 RepID=A0ABU4J282_9BACI|nr:hypothetical protein [Priestia flexa]MDW8515093.1 hypothetical protein [Priestia flexa]